MTRVQFHIERLWYDGTWQRVSYKSLPLDMAVDVAIKERDLYNLPVRLVNETTKKTEIEFLVK